MHWLFEAKKRFGLSVLNYMITLNHVHLLIKDTGPNVIADSMQLIAGRTAQEYNQRKDRQALLEGQVLQSNIPACRAKISVSTCDDCVLKIDLFNGIKQ